MPISEKKTDQPYFNEFKTGLFQPSWLSVGTLMSVCIFLLFCFYFIAPSYSTFIDHIRHYPGIEKLENDDLYLLARIHELKTPEPNIQQRILVLGTSSMMSGLQSERSLEKLLENSGITNTRVIDLSSSGQSIWKTLALLDQGALFENDVVIMGVTLNFMTEVSLKASLLKGSILGLGFDSPALIQVQKKIPGSPTFPHTGIYLIDHRTLVSTYIYTFVDYLWNQFQGRQSKVYYSPTSGRAKIGKLNLPNKKSIELQKIRIIQNLNIYEEESKDGYLVLNEIVELLKGRGIKNILLYSPPVNQECFSIRTYSKHTSAMKQFSERKKVSFSDGNEFFQDPEDFLGDCNHLFSDSAIHRSTQLLADTIIKMLHSSNDSPVIGKVRSR